MYARDTLTNSSSSDELETETWYTLKKSGDTVTIRERQRDGSGIPRFRYVERVDHDDESPEDSWSDVVEWESMGDDGDDDESEGPEWRREKPDVDDSEAFCPVCYAVFEDTTNSDGEVTRSAEKKRLNHTERKHAL